METSVQSAEGWKKDVAAESSHRVITAESVTDSESPPCNGDQTLVSGKGDGVRLSENVNEKHWREIEDRVGIKELSHGAGDGPKSDAEDIPARMLEPDLSEKSTADKNTGSSVAQNNNSDESSASASVSLSLTAKGGSEGTPEQNCDAKTQEPNDSSTAADASQPDAHSSEVNVEEVSYVPVVDSEVEVADTVEVEVPVADILDVEVSTAGNVEEVPIEMEMQVSEDVEVEMEVPASECMEVEVPSAEVVEDVETTEESVSVAEGETVYLQTSVVEEEVVETEEVVEMTLAEECPGTVEEMVVVEETVVADNEPAKQPSRQEAVVEDQNQVMCVTETGETVVGEDGQNQTDSPPEKELSVKEAGATEGEQDQVISESRPEKKIPPGKTVVDKDRQHKALDEDRRQDAVSVPVSERQNSVKETVAEENRHNQTVSESVSGKKPHTGGSDKDRRQKTVSEPEAEPSVQETTVTEEKKNQAISKTEPELEKRPSSWKTVVDEDRQRKPASEPEREERPSSGKTIVDEDRQRKPASEPEREERPSSGETMVDEDRQHKPASEPVSERKTSVKELVQANDAQTRRVLLLEPVTESETGPEPKPAEPISVPKTMSLEQQPGTAEPEPATKARAEQQPGTAEPEPATKARAEQQPGTAEPEPATKARAEQQSMSPESVTEPKPVTGEPEPETVPKTRSVEPQLASEQPEQLTETHPGSGTPEPELETETRPGPQSATEECEPALVPKTVEPEIGAAQTEAMPEPATKTRTESTPAAAEPKPVTETRTESTPGTAEPEPVTETGTESTPGTAEPEPVTKTRTELTPPTPEPEPVAETRTESQSPTEQPGVETEIPSEPQSATTQSESVTEMRQQPEPVTERRPEPLSATTRSEPVTEPKSATAESTPATECETRPVQLQLASADTEPAVRERTDSATVQTVEQKLAENTASTNRVADVDRALTDASHSERKNAEHGAEQLAAGSESGKGRRETTQPDPTATSKSSEERDSAHVESSATTSKQHSPGEESQPGDKNTSREDTEKSQESPEKKKLETAGAVEDGVTMASAKDVEPRLEGDGSNLSQETRHHQTGLGDGEVPSGVTQSETAPCTTDKLKDKADSHRANHGEDTLAAITSGVEQSPEITDTNTKDNTLVLANKKTHTEATSADQSADCKCNAEIETKMSADENATAEKADPAETMNFTAACIKLESGESVAPVGMKLPTRTTIDDGNISFDITVRNPATATAEVFTSLAVNTGNIKVDPGDRTQDSEPYAGYHTSLAAVQEGRQVGRGEEYACIKKEVDPDPQQTEDPGYDKSSSTDFQNVGPEVEAGGKTAEHDAWVLSVKTEVDNASGNTDAAGMISNGGENTESGRANNEETEEVVVRENTSRSRLDNWDTSQAKGSAVKDKQDVAMADAAEKQKKTSDSGRPETAPDTITEKSMRKSASREFGNIFEKFSSDQSFSSDSNAASSNNCQRHSRDAKSSNEPERPSSDKSSDAERFRSRAAEVGSETADNRCAPSSVVSPQRNAMLDGTDGKRSKKSDAEGDTENSAMIAEKEKTGDEKEEDNTESEEDAESIPTDKKETSGTKKTDDSRPDSGESSTAKANGRDSKGPSPKGDVKIIDLDQGMQADLSDDSSDLSDDEGWTKLKGENSSKALPEKDKHQESEKAVTPESAQINEGTQANFPDSEDEISNDGAGREKKKTARGQARRPLPSNNKMQQHSEKQSATHSESMAGRTRPNLSDDSSGASDEEAPVTKIKPRQPGKASPLAEKKEESTKTQSAEQNMDEGTQANFSDDSTDLSDDEHKSKTPPKKIQAGKLAATKTLNREKETGKDKDMNEGTQADLSEESSEESDCEERKATKGKKSEPEKTPAATKTPGRETETSLRKEKDMNEGTQADLSEESSEESDSEDREITKGKNNESEKTPAATRTLDRETETGKDKDMNEGTQADLSEESSEESDSEDRETTKGKKSEPEKTPAATKTPGRERETSLRKEKDMNEGTQADLSEESSEESDCEDRETTKGKKSEPEKTPAATKTVDRKTSLRKEKDMNEGTQADLSDESSEESDSEERDTTKGKKSEPEKTPAATKTLDRKTSLRKEKDMNEGTQADLSDESSEESDCEDRETTKGKKSEPEKTPAATKTPGRETETSLRKDKDMNEGTQADLSEESSEESDSEDREITKEKNSKPKKTLDRETETGKDKDMNEGTQADLSDESSEESDSEERETTKGKKSEPEKTPAATKTPDRETSLRKEKDMNEGTQADLSEDSREESDCEERKAAEGKNNGPEKASTTRDKNKSTEMSSDDENINEGTQANFSDESTDVSDSETKTLAKSQPGKDKQPSSVGGDKIKTSKAEDAVAGLEKRKLIASVQSNLSDESSDLSDYDPKDVARKAKKNAALKKTAKKESAESDSNSEDDKSASSDSELDDNPATPQFQFSRTKTQKTYSKKSEEAQSRNSPPVYSSDSEAPEAASDSRHSTPSRKTAASRSKENRDTRNLNSSADSGSFWKVEETRLVQDPNRSKPSIVSRITKALTSSSRDLGKVVPAATAVQDTSQPKPVAHATLSAAKPKTPSQRRRSDPWAKGSTKKRRRSKKKDGGAGAGGGGGGGAVDRHVAATASVGEEVKKCNICGKEFLALYRYKRHMAAHATGKNFCCDTCGKLFDSKEKLDIHSLVHQQSATGTFTCKHCGEVCKNWRSFLYHLSKHTADGGKKFTCEMCGHTLFSADRLRRHNKHHKRGLHFCCFTCGKLFQSQDRLDRHTKVHTSLNPTPARAPKRPSLGDGDRPAPKRAAVPRATRKRVEEVPVPATRDSDTEVSSEDEDGKVRSSSEEDEGCTKSGASTPVRDHCGVPLLSPDGSEVRKSSRKRKHSRKRCTCCPTSPVSMNGTSSSGHHVKAEKLMKLEKSDGAVVTPAKSEAASPVKSESITVTPSKSGTVTPIRPETVTPAKMETPTKREAVTPAKGKAEMVTPTKSGGARREGEQTSRSEGLQYNVALRDCSVKLQRSPDLDRNSVSPERSAAVKPEKLQFSAPVPAAVSLRSVEEATSDDDQSLHPPSSEVQEAPTSPPLSRPVSEEKPQRQPPPVAETPKKTEKSQKPEKVKRPSTDPYPEGRKVKIYRTASEKLLPKNLALTSARKERSKKTPKTVEPEAAKANVSSPKTPKSKRSYPCTICGENFPSDSAVKIHIGKHLTKSAPKEPVDIESVAQSCRLSFSRNSDKTGFSCHRCGYVARAYADLSKHMWMHSQKKFQCKECCAAFAKSDTLHHHMKAHGKAKATPLHAR
ncbi:microtubule-associated protein futsch-like [Littorina saxatilis]|uniref:C2H2-type domain-containing protein n=1 Tax=Littorina saxatilis TaxID=31220 RepID=A0AAN9B499_9CAEN